MIHAVLKSPRRLPARYNRRVQDRTRDLVRRRHGRHRTYARQQWVRFLRRAKQRWVDVSVVALRALPLVLLALTLTLIGVVVFSPLIEVREIRVIRSDRRVDIERVQRSLSPLFGEHLLFLTSKHVLPLLLAPVPDARNVIIDKQYPSTLILRIELEPIVAALEIVDPSGNVAPAPTFANDAFPAAGSGSETLRDYLTADGMYVTYPPSLVQSGTGTVSVRIVDWGVHPEPWVHLLDTVMLERIAQSEQILRDQFGESVSQRVVYLRSREFHVQTSKHSLWFDMRSSPAEQLDRYRLFLQSAGAASATRYVDLRLQDRIVYR